MSKLENTSLEQQLLVIWSEVRGKQLGHGQHVARQLDQPHRGQNQVAGVLGTHVGSNVLAILQQNIFITPKNISISLCVSYSYYLV